MGVPALWDILSSGFLKRVCFDEFVTTFIEKSCRPPKIAIDGYMLVFNSNHSSIVQETNKTIKRNIMLKIMYLVSLNVTFIIVFDGILKPNKIRNSKIKIDKSLENYEAKFNDFQSTNPVDYSENHDIIIKLKDELEKNKIDFLQAPAEAEAQCAYFQKLGVVDYVLSDDVDTFIFGATKVLRNFNRIKTDEKSKKYEIKSKIDVDLNRYYVTPVDLEIIEKKTGLNSNRLIFLVTLTGGDYSTGIRSIGIKNATKLALCGSKINKSKIKSDLPDLSKLFLNCFISDKIKSNIYHWYNIENSTNRKAKLCKFTEILKNLIKTKSVDIFGKKFTLNCDFKIDEYFPLLYLFPFVHIHIYKFMPLSLSCGEFKSIENDMLLSSSSLFKSSLIKSEKVLRINNVKINNNVIIGTLILEYDFSSKKNFIKKQIFRLMSNCINFTSEFELPITYNWHLKKIIIKLLSLEFLDDLKIHDFISIINSKIYDGVEYLRIKFNAYKLSKYFKNSVDYEKFNNKCSDNDKKSNYKFKFIENTSHKFRYDFVWIPFLLVMYVNPQLVFDYQKKKKKQYFCQKTTLEDLGFISKTQTYNPFDYFLTCNNVNQSFNHVKKKRKI